MRTKEWKMTVGEKELFEMLSVSVPYLKNANYSRKISYYYHTSTYDNRPSYELVISYGKTEIYAGTYIFDERFSSGIRQDEKGRIQNFLAAYAISIITACGIIYCICAAKSGSMVSYVIEEKEDKKFLCLQ